MPELETKVELLKQELHDQRKIHDRLDIAIEKLTDVSNSIDELHSRITTNTKEIMTAAAVQHKQYTEEIHRLRSDINDRVGILEKWRYIIIGGSIVSGFLLHKFINFS